MLSVSIALGMMLYLGKHFLMPCRTWLAVVSKMLSLIVMWQEKKVLDNTEFIQTKSFLSSL